MQNLAQVIWSPYLLQLGVTQPQTTPQEVKVAVDETGHQGVTHSIDHSGSPSNPILGALMVPYEDNSVFLDCNGFRSGIGWIAGENFRIGYDEVSSAGHRFTYEAK